MEKCTHHLPTVAIDMIYAGEQEAIFDWYYAVLYRCPYKVQHQYGSHCRVGDEEDLFSGGRVGLSTSK